MSIDSFIQIYIIQKYFLLNTAFKKYTEREKVFRNSEKMSTTPRSHLLRKKRILIKILKRTVYKSDKINILSKFILIH